MQTVPWRQAWSAALYGPDGFFLRHAPADHFRTSVAAAPQFAVAVRRLAGLVDDALGRPAPFDLVDVGAGRGTLLAALPDVPARWRLTGVDLAPDPGLDGIGWSAEVPELEGLLFSNEWLDDVPLDVVFDDRLVEVAPDGTEALGAPASPEAVDWASRWWPQGRRVEVGLTRDRAWTAAVGQVRRGLAVTVDYGHVLGDRRPTLTGWRNGRPVHPVPDGSCDITAHVALDAVAAASGGRLIPQADALSLLGIRSEHPPKELSRNDPHNYLAQLAAASSAAELLDRRGLGSYGWVVAPVGIADPLA
ncbi:MAG: SAM-dependent methyltransferase [Frankiaceae bacterium]|nr:SAM-dependent methyltransferase [Frankiaceae bacterium]